MVVDALICHWVILVVGEEAVPDGFERLVQWLVALFYANDGLIVSPRLTWLQAALDVFPGFSDMVGQTNINKIVRKVCQQCYISCRQLEAAYTRRMTGMGPSFWKRKREIFLFRV